MRAGRSTACRCNVRVGSDSDNPRASTVVRFTFDSGPFLLILVRARSCRSVVLFHVILETMWGRIAEQIAL